MRAFLPFATLLGAALLLGCQEQASSPVGPYGPQFTHNDPDKIHGGPKGGGNGDGGGGGAVPLFKSSGSEGVLGNATCAGGALDTGSPFGQVKWHKNSFDDHTHARVELTGVAQGDYDIFGNQDVLCESDIIDFNARASHPTSVTVGESGDANVRIGLTFGSEAKIPAGHVQGTTKLWLTIIGPEGVLRSPAVEVIIPDHVDP